MQQTVKIPKRTMLKGMKKKGTEKKKEVNGKVKKKTRRRIVHQKIVVNQSDTVRKPRETVLERDEILLAKEGLKDVL